MATGRDPLKKGPNDKVNTPTTILTSSQAKADATVNTGEGTLTDQLAKDYFGRYLSLQQNGQVTSDQAQQIALNTLASPQYTQATGVIYTKNNLRINTQTSADTFKTYSDTVNNIFLSRHPDHLGEEKTILQQAAETGNSTELNKLDPIIIAYRGLISDLLAVYVPADAVTIHLGLLNASSNVLQNIESMRVTFTDPVKSFAGVSQYDKHMSELAVALQNFQLYMDRKISTKP